MMIIALFHSKNICSFYKITIKELQGCIHCVKENRRQAIKSVGLETEESWDLEMQAWMQFSFREQNWATEVDQAAKEGESKEW